MAKNTLYSTFKAHNEGIQLPITDALFKYSTRVSDKSIDYICFVEGKTDVEFYNGVVPKLLNINSDKVYFINNGEDSGKKSVILSAKRFGDDNEHKQNNKKLLFIVDSDYDDNSEIINTSLNKYITLLESYSFENLYFTNDTNMIAIFKHFFADQANNVFDEFIEVFKMYIGDIIKYCAWKKTCHINRIDNSFLIHFKNDSKNKSTSVEKTIRNIKFMPNYSLPEDTLKFIHSALGEFHKKSKATILRDYNKNYCELLKQPVYLIKGKLLFSFLLDFIMYKLDTKDEYMIKNDLYSISEKLDIKIDLKIV